MDDAPGSPGDSDAPGLEHLEPRDCGVEQRPQFVRLSVARERLFACVSGDGARDGVVQTSVQRAKIIGADGRCQFHCQIGHGLAHIPIVVDDLRDREPLQQQIVSVLGCAIFDLLGLRRPLAQLDEQLIQE